MRSSAFGFFAFCAARGITLLPPPQTVRKLAIFRVLVRQSTHFLPYEKSGISAGFLDQFDCKKERQTDPSFSSRGRIFR